MAVNAKPASIRYTVVMDCGCICEYPKLGMGAEIQAWQVIACKEHFDQREEIASLAREALLNEN